MEEIGRSGMGISWIGAAADTTPRDSEPVRDRDRDGDRDGGRDCQ